MVKLVDMPDLGSGAARRVGSSPITRTLKAHKSLKSTFYGFFVADFAEILPIIILFKECNTIAYYKYIGKPFF